MKDFYVSVNDGMVIPKVERPTEEEIELWYKEVNDSFRRKIESQLVDLGNGIYYLER